jgi:hypothetical protein
MDADTFATLPSVVSDIQCPHCSNPHQLSELAVWLAAGKGRIFGDNRVA